MAEMRYGGSFRGVKFDVDILFLQSKYKVFHLKFASFLVCSSWA